jgi:hypothetical protein
LPEKWKELIPRGCNYFYKDIKQTVVITGVYYFYHIQYIKILSYIILFRITPWTKKIIGIIRVDFDIIDQILIVYFSSTGETMGV